MTRSTLPLAASDLHIMDGTRRNSTLICAPVVADSVDQMLVQMGKAKEVGADLVELRVDFLKNFSPRQDLSVLIKQSPLPTLVTYRPAWEGGQYKGDDKQRQDALRVAMDLGADFIDVELKVADEFYNSIQGRKPEKVKIIVSSHNYEKTPSAEEIGDLVARIQATGADIVKIATTGLDITDSARVFQVLAHSQVPMIGLVMGEKGLISRVLSAKYGAFLTFGTIEAGVVSAPGQPTVTSDLRNFSIASTFSYYTIPHDDAGIKCCDEIDPNAKEIGAISCMIRNPADGKLKGYNMDYLGAIAAIEEGLQALNGSSNGSGSPLAGKLFVVIGAGGAGKALAYGGKQKGARVVVANRTYDKAKALANKVGGEAITLAELENFHPEEGMVLANTTPVGMKPRIDQTPLSKNALKNYSLVFDAIHTPKWTRLLQEAQESGAAVVSGTEMFLNQAFVQVEKFSGSPAPKQLIRDVLARNA